jgi:hypothetical protein
MSGANGVLDALAGALLDPGQPVPAGSVTWNGSDPAARFAVYRNNVVVSLVEALADTFPVTRELVGAPFFDAMARCFVAEQPPRSPILTGYGDGFPGFVAAFEPAKALAYLPDLARLELARVRAYHAADAEALEPTMLAGYLTDPHRLPDMRMTLHPSLTVLSSDHAIVSLWAAHQGEGRIDEVDPALPECALVARVGDDVLVLSVTRGTAAFVAALRTGRSLGDAAGVAAAREPAFDLASALALIIRHSGIVAWHVPGDLET